VDKERVDTGLDKVWDMAKNRKAGAVAGTASDTAWDRALHSRQPTGTADTAAETGRVWDRTGDRWR